jgi:hypothetical protein
MMCGSLAVLDRVFFMLRENASSASYPVRYGIIIIGWKTGGSLEI